MIKSAYEKLWKAIDGRFWWLYVQFLSHSDLKDKPVLGNLSIVFLCSYALKSVWLWSSPNEEDMALKHRHAQSSKDIHVEIPSRWSTEGEQEEQIKFSRRIPTCYFFDSSNRLNDGRFIALLITFCLPYRNKSTAMMLCLVDCCLFWYIECYFFISVCGTSVQ